MPSAVLPFPLNPCAAALLLALAASAVAAQPATAETPAATASAAAVRDYDLPAGPLGAALNRIARDAGLALTADAQLVEGRNAAPVRGRFDAPEALRRALAGSGLELRQATGGVFTLREASRPAAQAPRLSDAATLGAVTVTASAEAAPGDLPPAYAGGQVATGSRVGLLGQQSLMDTPFHITSYTAELMQDQQAITVADVLANDPSVRTVSYSLTNAAAGGDIFLIRGFSVQDSVLFDGIGGIATNRAVAVEAAERVEVLKGPNALLNGMAPGAGGAVGGAINLVPKRAGDVPLTRLTTTYLSKGNLGGHLDVGRRFGDDHQWGVRFNGVYRDGKTATQGQSVELGAAALAVDYRGSQLRASVDAGHQTMNNEAPQGAAGFGIDDAIAIPRPPRASHRIAQDWEFARSQSNYLLAKAEYDLTPDWMLSAAAGGSHTRSRYLATDVFVTSVQGDAQATTYFWPNWTNYRTVQGGLQGTVRAGELTHRIHLHASYLKKDSGFTAQYYGFDSFATNMYAPAATARPSIDGFSSRPPQTDSLQLPSVALADTVSLWQDRLSVTLGARYQRVKVVKYDTTTGAGSTEYDEHAVTPALAAVFKLQPHVSLYGNYIEGLVQGDSAPLGTTNAGQVFPPVRTKQREVGVKADWGRFSTTASLFHIQKPSGLVGSNGDGTFTYQVGAEQRNRGVELNVFGEVARGTRLLGGVTFNDARLTKTEGGTYNGNAAPNVSRWQLNLGSDHDVAAVPGLTLSARMIASSAQHVDAANLRRIPGWTRWDIGARYKIRAGGRPLVLRAGVDNLFNRNYWSSGSGNWLYVGSPRTVTLSATVDF
ncbi:iron complex outermembrane receptor protein [Acidovorax sp. 93]|uniref:TonB-dependent receptor n=1 Tax=Acidovorax sp. 93 TaxID=2135632 RepID=UPI000EB60FF1|nr:TonB-dependent receptor [Acidovorax sp. 93]RKR25501.1 iron complex outermembrane receptor protein [Acidovorax sp. 93]